MSDAGGTHVPVMLDEVLEALGPRDGERIIDATFGAGGYTRGILEAADCKVLALDRDPSAIAAGACLVEAYSPRLQLKMMPFGALQALCEDLQSCANYSGTYDGVVFDLGVSSMQLDEADRGFSFQSDGPLDMRMFCASGHNAGEDGPSAADVINTYDEERIADILFQLGEERRSRAIARAVVARRETEPFARTLDLAAVVETALGGRRGAVRHPATKTFQALRMFVNDEIGQLLKGLAGAERCLAPGGRLVVVTFHSLEDRIVKRFFASRVGREAHGSRHLPQANETGTASSFQIVNQRSLTSSKAETEVNPRARSARLRRAVRTGEPAALFDVSGLGVPRIAL